MPCVSKPQKINEEGEVAAECDSNGSAPHDLLSGNRMPDIQWLFRRPSTPYTGVMQKVLESGYGTKHSMRRMLEAFQSVDADKMSPSPALTADATAPKAFKIITFRGLPLPPPPPSRANLKRLITIIQSDWELRRKGGLMKGEEGMVPVVPIPRKPTVHLKHRDREALAEAAASGNLRMTLASLGLAMSSQGALVRAGTDLEIADENKEANVTLDAAILEEDLKRNPKHNSTSSADQHHANEAEKANSQDQLASRDTMSSHASLLLHEEPPTPLGDRSGKRLFKTMGRRPNSNFACVSRPKSALSILGSEHKDVQKLPHHVKSGCMPPRATPCSEEDTALYWQSMHTSTHA